ncbi:hypothetical protein [Streptomyces sp. H39-S7]|uniref:hypothetical protein n=1 Tax=Streptomyces sp. H39-S7 TaxID=3004357 RepID=UPI0022AF75AF|nr:hypothetical protein [Streptomyces sp. H39-S7]
MKRKVFFGSMMFETAKKDNGALGITTGVENPAPLIVLFLLLTAVLALIQIAFRGLKQRREELLKEISGS